MEVWRLSASHDADSYNVAENPVSNDDCHHGDFLHLQNQRDNSCHKQIIYHHEVLFVMQQQGAFNDYEKESLEQHSIHLSLQKRYICH